MLSERSCKLCGNFFVPTNGNQQYCCKECGEYSAKKNKSRREKAVRLAQKNKKAIGCKGVVEIEKIVDICKKFKEKTGRTIDYGYASYLSDFGKIGVLGVNL